MQITYGFKELYDLKLEKPLPFDDGEVDNIIIEYDEDEKTFRFSLFNECHFVEDVEIT